MAIDTPTGDEIETCDNCGDVRLAEPGHTCSGDDATPTNPEKVDGMTLIGATAMVGTYDDGTREVRLSTVAATSPLGARWAFEDGTLRADTLDAPVDIDE